MCSTSPRRLLLYWPSQPWYSCGCHFCIGVDTMSSLCMFRVAQHHMREGQLLTQTQEEMILIGGFGLFWLGTYVRPWPGLVPFALLSFPLSTCSTVDGGGYFCPTYSSRPNLCWSAQTGRSRVCLFLMKSAPIPSSPESPPYFCPCACGPVVLRAAVTDLGGIGRFVQTSYFQPF